MAVVVDSLDSAKAAYIGKRVRLSKRTREGDVYLVVELTVTEILDSGTHGVLFQLTGTNVLCLQGELFGPWLLINRRSVIEIIS